MNSETFRFALGTFINPNGGAPFSGLVMGDRVAPLKGFGAQAPQFTSLFDLFENWDDSLTQLEQCAQSFAQHSSMPLATFKALAPYTNPRQILCVGANYRKHVVDIIVSESKHLAGKSKDEARLEGERMMDERAATGVPYAWNKTVSCITGPNDAIVLPRDVSEPDWELELAIIIGRPAYRVSREDAFNYIAAYAIANDVTARDQLYRADMPKIGTDWLASKCRPTFLPFGPYLVPRQFVPDPHDVRITLKLNGQTMQDESTSDMIFKIPRLVEYISSKAKLFPGDIICTGSPAGNGAHYGRYLRAGDRIESTITGLGVQHNVCVAEE